MKELVTISKKNFRTPADYKAATKNNTTKIFGDISRLNKADDISETRQTD